MIAILMESVITVEKILAHILRVETAPASAIKAVSWASFIKLSAYSGKFLAQIKPVLAVRFTIDHATN